MVLFGPINPTTKRMPEVVRAALAADIANPTTPEGAAVAAVAASVGGGGGGGGDGVAVTLGPTPPTNGFWVETAAASLVATAPTFSDPSGSGSDGYTIPTTANVEYRIGGIAVAAGTYAGSGTVTVTAHAASGYVLIGTSSWTYTFSGGTTVTATAPTFDDVADNYVIPTSTGVDYQISSSTVAAGTYSVGNIATSVTVTAVPQSGYALAGTTSWTGIYTVSASMWKPAGSTVLTSDSFTGSGNAESRATDCAWGGSPVTPAATVAGAFVVDGDMLDTTAVGRLRYTISGSGRVYLGVKVSKSPLSVTALDLRYGLPTSSGTVPSIKLVNSSAQNRVGLYEGTTLQGSQHVVALGDEVGFTVDGTVTTLYINGTAVQTGATALAANTTHGFVAFGAVPDTISDFIVAALA